MVLLRQKRRIAGLAAIFGATALTMGSGMNARADGPASGPENNGAERRR